jgi:4-amino-4-deoxy-L-arabinose transferase-like glycosyltransferase
LLLLYSLYLARYFAPAISTPDANGYWAQGSLLAKTGRTWFTPASDVQYIGIHWLVAEDGRYFSRYSPGLAVPIALGYRLFGYAATVLINPVLAVLGLFGMFLLSRRLLGPWWGVFGALLLTVTPDYARHALQNDSHMAVTALLIWGMWLLLRWHQDGRWPDILGAGVVLGTIPAVRYPEALFALGVGGLLLLHLWRQPRRWPHALLGLAGALLPLLPLMLRNQLAFGAFWRTAYSLTHEQTGFAWEYFQAHAVDYVRALNANGVGLFFGLGLAGMALMWFRRDLRPWAAFLSLAVVPITLLYMAYYWVPGRLGGESAAMRFVLPTFPCYYLSGMWALQTLAASQPRRAVLVLAAVTGLCQGVWGAFNIAADTPRQCYSRQALAVLTHEMQRQVPRDAIVFSAPAVLQHLDFVRWWRCADLSGLRPRAGRLGRRAGADPEAPMPMQAEKQRIASEKYAGQGLFGRERAIAYDLREWAAGAPVYFVGSDEEMQRLAPSYFGGRYLTPVARVQMPPPPPSDRGEGGRRAPPGRPNGPGGEAPGGAAPAEIVLPGAGPALDGGPLPGPGPLRGGGGLGLPGGAARFPRLQGPAGGLLGLSPDVREMTIAEWTWQPAGPR